MSANSSTTYFASVNGAILSDIVIDQRTKSGRGKKLTLAQENVLKRLYELELPLLPDGQPPAKRFWVNLASRFQQCTGRDYSWLSVRRKLANSGNESQRPAGSQPSEYIAQVGDESQAVESAPLNAINDPPRQHVPRNGSQLPEKQDQASMDRRGSNSSEYSRLEKSPPVVAEWTRRTLFPDAMGLSQQTHSISGFPQLSESTRPLRSPSFESQPAHGRSLRASSERTEVVSRRLHHQLGTVLDEDHLPDPSLPCVSPPPASYDRNETTHISSKRKHSTMDRGPTLLDGLPRLSTTQSPSSQKSATKSSGESCSLSDSDGLPEPPARISRKCRISRKKGKS